MAEIAVMGHGVVGSGVMEVLISHRESFKKRAKEEVHVKYILDLRDFPGLPYSDRFTKDFNVILNDPDSEDVWWRCMGGLEPAFSYVKSLPGKRAKAWSPPTRNWWPKRAPSCWPWLRKTTLNFLFEASVGGGIPIIRPMQPVPGCQPRSTEIAGHLKRHHQLHPHEDDPGAYAPLTTRFGPGPAAGLCRAGSLRGRGGRGRLPENLHFGLPGLRHAMCIPSRSTPRASPRITLEDVEYAERLGRRHQADRPGETLENGRNSHPWWSAHADFPEKASLANVDDVFNGILVRGDATGDVVFYGKGAGKLPTASAVVADVIDCVQAFARRGRYLFWEDAQARTMWPIAARIPARLLCPAGQWRKGDAVQPV